MPDLLLEKPDAHSAPTQSSLAGQDTHASHLLGTKSLRHSILSTRETPSLCTEEQASGNYPEASTQMQEGPVMVGLGSRDYIQLWLEAPDVPDQQLVHTSQVSQCCSPHRPENS